jgi:hypothetical protein
MADTPEAVGQPQESKDPVGGKAPEPAGPFRVFATEADFKEFEAKRAEKHNRELERLRRENETLKTATQTEAEKAAALERAKLETEQAKAIEAAERKAEIKALLMSKGLTREQAGHWAQMAGDEWEDPDEAVKDLQNRLGVALDERHKSPVAGGGGRNQSGSEIAYTPEYIAEMMAKHGPSWYTPEIRAKADAYRQAHFSGGPRRMGH